MSISGFTWLLEGELAAMALPGGSAAEFRRLRERGVGALVNLTLNDWPAEALGEADLEYLHLPVRDFSPPRMEQVERFVRFCQDNVAAGRPVAVHCVAGLGRTGTMVACYMVRRGMAPERAVEWVRQRRPGAIETPAQEQAVFEYARALAGRRGS